MSDHGGNATNSAAVALSDRQSLTGLEMISIPRKLQRSNVQGGSEGEMVEKMVVFLRGINVGGKNKLPMKGLVEIFAAAGCVDIETYIQSGNVVFRSDDAVAAGAFVRDQIATRYGIKVPVVLRRGAELDAAVRLNPFLQAGVEESSLHVMFLADEPLADRVAALDHARSPGDEFRVVGREIYLYLPEGAARTKLTNAYFDLKLKTVGTQRNWRTVVVLAGMCK